MTSTVLLSALLVAVLVSAYLGFALLALSQDRHWHHLGGGRHCPPRAALPIRVVGYMLLLASFVLAIVRDGASFGTLVWATAISVSAFAVVCTLTWRAHWLRPLVRLLQGLAT